MQYQKYLWLALLTLLSLHLGARSARANVPSLLPLQGYLTDATDVALDGSYNVTFRLYDAPTNGNKLHEELVTVFVTSGYFTAYLGDDNLQPLDMTKLRDAGAVFLTIDVDVDDNGTGDGESVPRMQLGSNAFAAQALYCGDAVTVGGKAPSDFADASHTHPWGEVTGKPATFPPSAHSHSGADIDSGTIGNAYFGAYSDLGSEGYLDNNAGSDLITQAQGDTRYAASSHNHAAGAITSGTLNPNYYSAYSDLTAEGYLDNSAAGDLLTQAQGDGRYAGTAHNHAWADITSGVPASFTPSAHVHSGTDITSGTVGTNYFSAYADLAAEGYLDNNAAGDMLTRVQNDTRYLQLGGGTLTGALSTSGTVSLTGAANLSVAANASISGSVTTGPLAATSIQWSSPQTGYLIVGASEFLPVYTTTHDDYSVYASNESGIFGSALTGTVPNISTLFLRAPVHLPQGATVTEMRCYYYDNTASNDFDALTFYLLKTTLATTSSAAVFSGSVALASLTNLVSTTVQEFSVTGSSVVDNAVSKHYIEARPSAANTTYVGTALMFRGCRVTYTMQTLGLPG